ETADADSEKSKKVSQTFLVSAHSVKDAYDRIRESLSTLMVDFLIPSIIVSPIVEIFPPEENLDRELSRRPLEEADTVDNPNAKGVVFSASGSDFDEEDGEEMESELEDNYSDED